MNNIICNLKENLIYPKIRDLKFYFIIIMYNVLYTAQINFT